MKAIQAIHRYCGYSGTCTDTSQATFGHEIRLMSSPIDVCCGLRGKCLRSTTNPDVMTSLEHVLSKPLIPPPQCGCQIFQGKLYTLERHMGYEIFKRLMRSPNRQNSMAAVRLLQTIVAVFEYMRGIQAKRDDVCESFRRSPVR